MNALRYCLCFFLTAALLLGLLLLSTLVPRQAIRPQMQKSAEYLCEGELFGEAVEGISSSRIDRYADSILLGIAFQFDRENALRSVMEDSYYRQPYQNENENLRDAVEKDLPGNQQYLRYWHGSAGIVRVLMAFLTLPQIYLWHGILMGLLALGLLFRLIRRKAWIPAAGILAGLVGSACWLVPLSLEYTWVFLILLVQMHLVLMKSFPADWTRRCMFFLVSGILTNYLDFLTCETLTLLAPLLLLLWLGHSEGREAAPWKTLAKAAGIWLAGYTGMYLLKWGLAAIVMGENVFPLVTASLEKRTIGTPTTGFQLYWLEAPLKNLLNLFPMNYNVVGILAGCLLAAVAAYLGYVHHRKRFDRQLVVQYAVIGLIPYVRYLVLANHSFNHVFFTFRAQLATLLAAVLILGEVTGWGTGKRERL